MDHESVLPLVLFTLPGGDMKPYEFQTQGKPVMAGKGAKFNDRSYSACSVIGFQFLAAKTLFCFS